MAMAPPLANVAAIRGLDPLNYARFRYPAAPPPHPSPAQSPVRARARWLAAGLGDASAALCAARSFLSAEDPTLLVSVTPLLAPRPKGTAPTPAPALAPAQAQGFAAQSACEAKFEKEHQQHRNSSASASASTSSVEMSAELWVFTSRDISDMTCDTVLCHVTDIFDTVESGTWRGDHDCAAVTPLVSALRDAVHYSFQTRLHGLTLGSEHVYVPSANIVYRIRLALDHDASVSVNLSVMAPAPGMRAVHLTDLDCDVPCQVLIAPLAVRATLQPRRRAGEALAASVLDRWADASLLYTESRDEPVVFVNVGEPGTEDSTSFPLPMRSLLLVGNGIANGEIGHLASGGTASGQGAKENNAGGAGAVGAKRKVISSVEPDSKQLTPQRHWHSLKRPRSPSADVEALEQAAKKELNEVPRPSSSQPATDVSPSPAMITSRKLDVALIDQAIAAAVPTKGAPPSLYHPLAPHLSQLGYFDNDGLGQAPIECGMVGTNSGNKGVQGNGNGSGTTMPTDLAVSVSGGVNAGAQTSVIGDPLNDDIGAFGDTQPDLLSDKKDESEAGGGFDIDELGGFDDDVTQFFGSADVAPAAPTVAAPLLGNRGLMAPSLSLGVKLSDRISAAMDIDLGPGLRAADGKCSTAQIVAPPISANGSGSVSQAKARVPSPDITSAWFAKLAAPNITERPPTPQRTEQIQAFLAEDLASRLRARSRPGTVLEETTKKRPAETEYVFEGSSRISKRDVYIPRRAMQCFKKKFKPSLISSESDSDSCTVDDDGYDSVSDSSTTEESNTATASAYRVNKHVPGDIARNPSNGNSPCSVVVKRALFTAATVAVDCASACYLILSAEPNLYNLKSSLWLVGASSVARVPSFPLQIELPSTDGDTHSTGSRAAVVRGKGERGEIQKGQKDNGALISLFQMQLIGAPEIQLLDASGMERLRIEQDEKTVTSRGSWSSNNLGTVVDDVASALKLSPAAPALVRRALQGFPDVVQSGRLLEYQDEMDTSESEFAQRRKLAVSGPLLLEDTPKMKVPRICVGYDGGWVETGGGILPLWEKSGMEPYANAKSIQFAALAPKGLADDVRCFFRDVSAAYEECSLGRHSPMPFDSLSLIANSVPGQSRFSPFADPDVVTTAESRMIQQYHLAAAGLATKLTAVARDARKSDTIGPNFVIYVVSPFPRSRRAAVAALFKAVTPLVSCIPNTVVSSGQSPSLPPGLVSSPWRLASTALPVDQSAQPPPQPQLPQPSMGSSNGPANGSLLLQSPNGVALGLTVRMLPWEVVERYPLDVSARSHPSRRSLRPQLVKSVAFAVYGSLRSRRLRRSVHDNDALGGTHPGEASELLSPMTPDIAVVGSPSNGAVAPLSPSSTYQGDSITPACFGLSNWDQGMSSFLYDPPFVLAGVGERSSQIGPTGVAVFHLSYSVIEEQCKCVFAWTDSRGETLDVAVMCLDKVPSGGGRSKIFSAIWRRGQRWWMSYVDQTCVTIAKVGQAMSSGEIEDWKIVVQNFISSTNSQAEFPSDRIEARLRFPREKTLLSSDNIVSGEGVDVVRDAATPATPASMPAAPISTSTGSGQANTTGKAGTESVIDASLTTLRSVTIMTIMENNVPDLVASETTEEITFVTGKGSDCEAKATMVVDAGPGKKTRQVELAMLAHFGVAEVEKQPSCDWDNLDAASTLRHIAVNFNALRAVASPPCWPRQSWLSSYPLHVDAVWNLRKLLCSFLGAKVNGK